MHLTMNTKERERLKVLHRIANNELTIANAARSLSVSERQMYRILLRYHDEGDAGIIHKSRGIPSPHRTETHIRKQVTDVFRQKYRDYGATLFAEKLEELNEELEVLNAEARELEERIGENVATVLQGLYE